MIDISKDWIVCLLVSRTEEVPRGKGKPPKKNDAENEQFPVSVEVEQLDSAEDHQDSLPESGCKNFAPSTVVTVRTEKNSADDEEYQLFGTPSLQSSVDGEVQTENTSNHTPASSEEEEDEPQVDVGNEESDEEEDEMDDDSGMLFSLLMNVEGLNFLVNNELTSSSVMKDYLMDECFQEGELQNECLLIVLYEYYLRLTQKNNFNRTMKNKKWLGKTTEKKLVHIKKEV